jgi:hypothetical protein
MAATAAILDLVSVDYLMNACVDWSDFLLAQSCQSLGVINLHHVPFLHKPYLPYYTIHPQTTCATPCVALVFFLFANNVSSTALFQILFLLLRPFFFISWFTGPPTLKFPISEEKNKIGIGFFSSFFFVCFFLVFIPRQSSA